MTPCRSCGAPVLWVHTTTGRTMPLDAEPTTDGNVVLTGRTTINGSGVARSEARVETTQPLFEDGNRYRSHFATCPHADQWRHGR